MKLGEPGVTYLSFPPNFQTAENKAMGYAVDRQMKKLLAAARKISVWSDLDKVEPKYFDFLAASLRAPYYSSEYDDDIRLGILKRTLQTYMFSGTVLAEEELLKNIFADAEFVPWYRYRGRPYHFKIKVSVDSSEEMVAKFLAILKRVKSQRSILDGMETKTYEIDVTEYFATGTVHYTRLEEVKADD